MLTDAAWAEHASNSADRAAPAREGTQSHARASEAEASLRDVVSKLLLEFKPGTVQVSEAQSRLGDAIAVGALTNSSVSAEERNASLVEAEKLLLESHTTLISDPTVQRRLQSDSFRRLIRLYKHWDKPGEAEKWDLHLNEFEAEKARTGEVAPAAK